MNRTFKLVGRYSANVSSRWNRAGLQAKKRVYTSLEDFLSYAPKTACRWRKFCGYDVSAFELIDGKWEPHRASFAGPSEK